MMFRGIMIVVLAATGVVSAQNYVPIPKWLVEPQEPKIEEPVFEPVKSPDTQTIVPYITSKNTMHRNNGENYIIATVICKGCLNVRNALGEPVYCIASGTNIAIRQFAHNEICTKSVSEKVKIWAVLYGNSEKLFVAGTDYIKVLNNCDSIECRIDYGEKTNHLPDYYNNAQEWKKRGISSIKIESCTVKTGHKHTWIQAKDICTTINAKVF